jgi:glycosyltransferase involved in cell wall biosynthesis
MIHNLPQTTMEETVAPRVSALAQNQMKPPKGPVRVLFMIDNLGHAGTEQWLLRLIHGLDRSRVEPFLCLLDGEIPLSRSIEPENLQILRLGIKKIGSLASISAAIKFTQFVKRNRIGILQLHFPDTTHFGAPLGWLIGVKKIIATTRNAGHWLSPSEKRRFRLTSRFLTDLVANSNVSLAAARAYLQVSEMRSVVIPSSVSMSRFESLEPRAREIESRRSLQVGMVANLRSVKNIETFIKAAAEVILQIPNVDFLVAGEGPERGYLEELTAKLELQDRFRLLGTISDVPCFLGSLDIAVLTSKSEGCSNSVLEYMAAGRPIIASDIPANRELIDNEKNGLLFPAEDHLALAHAIIRLATNVEFACEISKNARLMVKNTRTPQEEILSYENLYLHCY